MLEELYHALANKGFALQKPGMSLVGGHSRRCGRAMVTSGQPWLADISIDGRNAPKEPKDDIPVRARLCSLMP